MIDHNSDLRSQTPPPFSDVMPLEHYSTPQPPIWSLKGRFGRFNYLAWSILFGLIYIGIVTLLASLTSLTLEDLDSDAYLNDFFSIGTFLNLIWIIPFILFSIKRLHDRNHSGWWCLLLLIPLVNIFVGLYLILSPGSLHPNQYGHKRETPLWENMLATIYLIIFSFACVGLLFAFIQVGFPMF